MPFKAKAKAKAKSKAKTGGIESAACLPCLRAGRRQAGYTRQRQQWLGHPGNLEGGQYVNRKYI